MNLSSILATPRVRRIGRQVLIACAIVLPLRAFAIAPYRVVSNSVAPEVPQYSRVAVWKVGSQFAPGDLAVYHNGEHDYIGRVKDVSPESLTISQNSKPDSIVSRRSVVGRVFLSTR
jgi:signal peptidase I